ncbi:uncharacterized PE-PGRS family protein PE_PGRS46-like [Penaeus chinensis]|uniref:uncharacterized PE-PGRS family protein PE_PGRS46-like n=1 Tax=Penaeus chinensis TaxID=139456 RepID=UPI001FB59DF8|nr:uncharacterized PE-PGRS family protein PE_PGRS46-like [Penaeus chinensis]
MANIVHLLLTCVVPVVPQGYGSGGHGGLGVDLGGTGGHGGSDVGGGSVLPGVLVGSGELPESAIGGVGGSASAGAAGGVIGECDTPTASAAGIFDAGVAGNAIDVGISEEYTTPEVSPASPPDSEYAAPH